MDNKLKINSKVKLNNGVEMPMFGLGKLSKWKALSFLI